MSVDLQDAVTLAAELAEGPPAIWRHHCPAVGAIISEHDQRLLECRCFQGASFLAAQDSIAVAVDAARTPKQQ